MILSSKNDEKRDRFLIIHIKTNEISMNNMVWVIKKKNKKIKYIKKNAPPIPAAPPLLG